MSTVLASLFAVSRDSGDLDVRVEALPPEDRASLGEEARRAASDAVESGDLGRAVDGFRLAAALYRAAEAWPQTIEAGIRLAEVEKVQANTIEQYEVARLRPLSLMGAARDMQLADLMFLGYRGAADSAYFGAELLGEQKEFEGEREWLLHAMRDSVAALEFFEVGAGSPAGLPFLTLLCDLSVKLQQRFGPADDPGAEVREALRSFALCIESVVPADLVLEDPERSSSLAESLARLSYSHGSPDRARTRLSASVESASSDGDLARFLEQSSALYAGERGAFRGALALRDLRQEFWKGVDGFREMSRSRAGRLWTAQQLDEMTGSMVSDSFADLILRDVDEAFRATETNRARVLLDELAGVTRDPPIVEAAEEALALEADILHLEAFTLEDKSVAHEARLMSRLPVGGLHVAPERIAKLEQLEGLYSGLDAGFIGKGEIAGLGEVIAGLRAGEVIVEYNIPYDPLDPAGELLAMVITHEGASRLHNKVLYNEETHGFIGRIQADGAQPMDVSPVSELILAARMGIQAHDEESAAADLASLYSALIEPLATRGVVPSTLERLIIVPHGVLNSVPFAALRSSEGRYLIEDVAVVTAPSASVWYRLQGRPAGEPTSLLAFADPTLATHEPLPDARAELDEVRRLLAGVAAETFVGAKATEATFRDKVAGKALLHFATHGEFPEEDVMDMHRILLAPAGGHDGRVHAEELRGMDLSDVALAVLSICDGGLARFGPGDEPYGLIPALLAAGANNVLAPLWAIDDRLGRMLIVEFYRRLLESGPAEALREASLVALRGGAAIRDWAGFALVGSGRPLA